MSWGFADLPDWLRMKIQGEYEIEALAWVMGKDIRQGKATDTEVCAALYCSGLSAPLTHDATEIYLYLCTSLLQEKGTVILDESIRVLSLTKDQERTLEEYRHLIYRKRGKAETPISRAVKEVFGTVKRPKKSVEEPCSTLPSNSWMEPLFQKSIQTNLQL